MTTKHAPETFLTKKVTYLGQTILLTHKVGSAAWSWRIGGRSVVSSEPTEQEAIAAAQAWIASH